MVNDHKGIAVGRHTETRSLPGGREERNEHPGYEWLSCRICGSEFERGIGSNYQTCEYPGCGKAAV